MEVTQTDPQNLCSQFSELPDEMIHGILDNLPLEDAVQTSLISQRWKNSWKYITKLDLGLSWLESTGKEVFPSVNHFIRLHMGGKIQKFSVQFTYEPHMSDHVDSWIQFATNKKVESLHLDFDVFEDGTSYISRDPSYVMDASIFNCDSLIVLKLKCCIIMLPNSISLQNLKEIYFYQMDLENTTVHRLTSNTPVLAVLSLIDCNKQTDLHINIAPSPHFKSLRIADVFFADRDTKIDVKAPSAKEFFFDSGSFPRKSYNIEISSVCKKVSLLLDSLFVWSEEITVLGSGDETVQEEQGEEEEQFSFPMDSRNTQIQEQKLLDILGFCKGVESLKISNWCLQVLALRERRNTRRLQFNCKSLKLYTHFNKWELPGITYMLKACPRLEKLTMVSPSFDNDIEPPDLYVNQDDFSNMDYLNHMHSVLRLPYLRILVIRPKARDHLLYSLQINKLQALFLRIKQDVVRAITSKKGIIYIFRPRVLCAKCNRFSLQRPNPIK